MNERIIAMRTRVMRSSNIPDQEHQKLRQESLERTTGEPEVIREAKAMAHYFRNRALVIQDGELIVGSSPWFKVESKEILPNRGIGRTTFTSPWEMPESIELFFKEGMIRQAGNHTTMDYETILSGGFLGLIERIQRKLSGLSPDEEDYEGKRNFLTALKIIAEAYIDFCNRYADYAVALSQECHHEPRRQELLTIAQNCQNVPARPPQSFWEACQSTWFSFFFLPDAPGRVDQYLYPFYQRDMANGDLTRDFAVELLSCLWLKYYERSGVEEAVSAGHHLTLGCVNPYGSSAANQLT